MKKICMLVALLLTSALCLASCNTAVVGISGAKLNENGELVLTLTDGTEQNVGKVTGENGTNGAKGDKGDTGATGAPGEAGADATAPQIKINEATNVWEISTDGGVTWVSTGVQATGNNGADAVAPQIKINQDTDMWEISTDGGVTWGSTGVNATGLHVEKIEYDEDGMPIITLTDGTVLKGVYQPEQAAEAVKQSTVTVSVRTETGTAIGSGFVYNAEGYICTNHHVIEDAVTVQVILPCGMTVDAAVVGSDSMADLAVLKVEGQELTPAKLGSSAAARVGESVMAIGTPASIDYAATATFGKLSATDRIVALTDDSGTVTKKMTLLQTDTPVNPGNSGGPLANMQGEVIGVVVMKLSSQGDTPFDNIGFAIPIDGAKVVIDAIIANGCFAGKNPVAEGRSLLGISGVGLLGSCWYANPIGGDYTRSEIEIEGYTYIPCDGVYVAGVNGANAIGRLQVEDIITKINGLNMYTVYDIIDQVNRYHGGDTITVTVMRKNGNDYLQHTTEITLLAE